MGNCLATLPRRQEVSFRGETYILEFAPCTFIKKHHNRVFCIKITRKSDMTRLLGHTETNVFSNKTLLQAFNDFVNNLRHEISKYEEGMEMSDCLYIIKSNIPRQSL